MVAVPDIYFLPEWGTYFETKEKEGKWTLFEFKNEIGHIYYPFILRRIPLAVGDEFFCDTITPYGFSGPVILECQEGKREELVAQYDAAFQRYCTEQKIVTEYVRFNPWLDNSRDFEPLYQYRNHGDMMSVDLTVNDFFMDEFSPKVRTQVRKAQNNKVEIEFDFTGDSAGEFYRLYQMTAKKNQIENDYYLFSEEFLRGSFAALKGRQFFLNAKYEGKTISSVFIVHHGNYMHSHLTGNDPEFSYLAANSLIQYEACRWGVENGKKTFQLGGATSESLARFKKSFTKKAPVDLWIAWKIRNQEAYDELTAIKEKSEGIGSSTYFPLYRG